MSTGMVGILLATLPYQFRGLHYIAVAVFVLTLAMFLLFSVISIVRYCIWPRKLVETFQHPTQSLTMAFVPIAMGTIINLTVHLCSPVWGEWVVTFAWTLWWIHLAISVAVCAYIPWLLYVPCPSFVLLLETKRNDDNLTAASFENKASPSMMSHWTK